MARGTRADAETYGKLHLFKKVLELRSTYQIRLLVYHAALEHKKLIIEVPKACKIHSSLRELVSNNMKNVSIKRF